MQFLDTNHKELLDLWYEKQEDYEEHLDSQKFKRDAEQAETWITAQEGFLIDEDHGVSGFELYVSVGITGVETASHAGHCPINLMN